MPITKTISFPPEEEDLYEWLKKQPNQSATVREALHLLRDKLAGRPTAADVAALATQLAEIRRAIEDLRASGVAVEHEVEEDRDAVEELMRKFGTE